MFFEIWDLKFDISDATHRLQLLVSVRFQILFHRPPGLLFSFPSLYLFTIGQKEYLVLPHRRGCFRRGFSSLVVLWIRDTCVGRIFRLRGYHRLWPTFPDRSTIISVHMPTSWEIDVSSATSSVRQPKLVTSIRGQTCVQLGVEVHTNNLDWSAFARRY